MTAPAETSPAEAAPVKGMTGRQLRKFTRELTETDSGASLGKVIGDVYTAIVAAAIWCAMVFGVAGQLGFVIPVTHVAGEAQGVTGLLSWLLAVLAVAGAASIAGRLGPVGADTAETLWWLSTPVDRRGLLRPGLGQSLGIAGAVLALAYPATTLVTGMAPEAGPLFASAAFGFGLGVALAGLLALVEPSRAGRRAAVRVADGLLLLGPIMTAALALTLHSAPGLPAANWPAAIAMVMVGCLIAATADRRLDAIPGTILHEQGSAMGGAVTALRSMDTRELSHALADVFVSNRPRRRSAWTKAATSPAGAIATADAIAFRRSPRRLLQLLLAVTIPLLAVLLTSQLSDLAIRIIAALALLIGGYAASLTSVEGPRQAFAAPVLDSLVPLSARETRLARLILPTLAVAVWAFVAGLSVAWALGLSPVLAAIAVLAAPGLAAAGLRAAYRKAPDWSGQLLVTPLGAYPPGVATVVAKGPDMAVLGSLPLVLFLLGWQNLLAVAALQVACSAIAIAVATSVKKKEDPTAPPA